MSRSHRLRFTSLVRSASTARRHKKRGSGLPLHHGLERLEGRWLLAGDLLITTAVPGKVEYNLTQYTQQGAVVDSQGIPQSPSATEYQDARGLTVDQNGSVHIVDGYFSPFLDTYSPGQQPVWSYQTAPGWIIGGNESYGEAAAYKNYVFASDLGADGIVRFNTSGGAPTLFASGTTSYQVTLGLDGNLYELVGQGDDPYPDPTIDVYNPDTLALVRSFQLSTPFTSDIRSIAVDGSGNIYAADWSAGVTKYDPSGKALKSLGNFGENLVNIAIDNDGQIAVGGSLGGVHLTDESLDPLQSFQTNQWNAFVTFDHYIGAAPQIVTPRVTVTDAGGVYNGSPYSVTAASVVGQSGVVLASLSNPSLSYSYYQGTLTAAQIATATPLPVAPTNVGDYTVVAHFTSNIGGYSNADSAPTPFAITPAALTYTIGNDSQNYGSPANLAGDLGKTISTGVNKETLDIAYASTGDTATGSVGSYAITGTLSNGSGLLSNYTLTLNNGTLTVNPYALADTIGNDSQIAGLPANLAADLPGTIAGVNGEDLKITYASAGDTATATPAKYPITGTLSNGSGLLSNYTVTLNPGTLTVTKYGAAVIVSTLLDAPAANASLSPFDTNGNGEISLRSAIAYLDANGGGSVTFAPSLFASGPGTIALSLGDLSVTKAITIAGPGADQLTIDAGGNSRIFYIYDPTTIQQWKVSLSGLALTGGNGKGSRTVDDGRGGALFNAEVLALSHVVITNNSADAGGGVNNAGTLTSTDNVVSGNHATGVAGDGGGIYNTGIMSSSGDTISDNTAVGLSYSGQGGGIWNGSQLTLANDTIRGNTASGLGGGIANFEQLTSSNDSISGNSGVFQGGGIYNARTLSSTLDTISGNTANPNINGDSLGGGVADDNSASLTTLQDTISGNQAVGRSLSGLGGPARGGGVYVAYQAAYTSGGDTISGNSAQGGAALAPAGGQAGSAWGGGVEVSDQSVVRLTNDTISGNRAIGGDATSTTAGMVGPGSGAGAGIDNTFGSLTLTADTISGNTAVGGTGTSTNGMRANSPALGGGIYSGGGTINLIDSIVVGNSAATTAANIYGSLSAASRANLVDTPVADVLNTDSTGNPLLANNGGPTETIALVPRTTNPAVGTAAALATLESALNATDASDTITVDSATFLAVGDALKIGSETVTIQQLGATPNTFSVLRAQDGTTEASHAAGDPISLAYDQRGLPRHAAPDIGAFETQTQTQTQTPTVTVTDAGGGYTGSADPVTAASVVGQGGTVLASLGDPSLSYSYYQGALTAAQVATATPLPGAPTDAGSYTVVAHYTSDVAGYTSADSAPTSFSITPAKVTYTISNDSQTYGSPADLTNDLGTTINTGVNGETLDVTYASAGDSATANVGGYAITGTLADGSGLLSNYTVTLNSGTLTVNPYGFSYTIGNDKQTYGSPADLAKDLGTTINTGVNGETLGITYASGGDTPTANVGGYDINGTLADGSGLLSNYSVTLNNGTLTVDPYAFSYTIGNDSQTYGSPANLANDLGTTISTGVNGETLDITYASTGDTPTANVGSYDITGALSNGSGSLSNYTVTLTNGTLTVNPYAFTYTIGNASQTYGSPTNLASDLPATINTGVNGETLDISYASTGATATANVGSYDITGALADGSGLLSNYTVTLNNGTLTVDPYAFSYTIGNASQTYGSPANLASDLPATINTGVNGETLDITYASTGDTPTANVGSYDITGTLADGSGLLSNYSVTLTNGTLTVNPYAFTYTIGNDLQVEGFPANLAADLPATIAGVNGETLSIAYASAGDTASAAPGAYPITGTLSNGSGLLSNYSVTLNPGTLTVAGPGATAIGDVLYLIGGNTNDHVDVSPVGPSGTGSSGIQLDASLNGVHIHDQVYSQSFKTIYVVGFGGNDHIDFAPSLTIPTVVREGDGNDQVWLGNGNNTVTVGNGNDDIRVGDGNNVIVAGGGSDNLQAGNGDNLIVGGLGHSNISAGNGDNILIDGSVSQSADQLWSVLDEWMSGDVADVQSDLAAHVTYNTTKVNSLQAGSGRDWFWETYAKDHVNIKPGDLHN